MKTNSEIWAGFFSKNNSLDPLRFSLARETDTIEIWAILENFNSWMIKLAFIRTKIEIRHLVIWLDWSCGQFYYKSIETLQNCSALFCVSVTLARKDLKGLR